MADEKITTHSTTEKAGLGLPSTVSMADKNTHTVTDLETVQVKSKVGNNIDAETTHDQKDDPHTYPHHQQSTVKAEQEEQEEEALQVVVGFDQPFDSQNPKDWPLSRKWLVTAVLSATAFNRIMVSTIMAPALPAIATELYATRVESVMAMSVYLLATAFGPLIWGPLSEIYGRKPVLHLTNVWFLIWNVVCGCAHSKGLLLAARLLAGFSAGAVYVLAIGVLGDVWRPEQRGRSLGLYILVPLLAVAIGPILGGLIVRSTTWRWIFWSTSLFQVLMTVLSFAIFRETYAPLILQRKADRLRIQASSGAADADADACAGYRTSNDTIVQGRSAFWILKRSLPIRLLLLHPIIQIQACLSGLSYGILCYRSHVTSNNRGYGPTEIVPKPLPLGQEGHSDGLYHKNLMDARTTILASFKLWNCYTQGI